MNPRVTIIRAGGSVTVTMIVASATIVNPWYIQPPPSTGGQWDFSTADNSDQAMLIW